MEILFYPNSTKYLEQMSKFHIQNVKRSLLRHFPLQEKEKRIFVFLYITEIPYYYFDYHDEFILVYNL